jgi:hypothetical protein
MSKIKIKKWLKILKAKSLGELNVLPCCPETPKAEKKATKNIKMRGIDCFSMIFFKIVLSTKICNKKILNLSTKLHKILFTDF